MSMNVRQSERVRTHISSQQLPASHKTGNGTSTGRRTVQYVQYNISTVSTTSAARTREKVNTLQKESKNSSNLY